MCLEALKVPEYVEIALETHWGAVNRTLRMREEKEMEEFVQEKNYRGMECKYGHVECA